MKPHCATDTKAAALAGMDELGMLADPDADELGAWSESSVMLAMVVAEAPSRGMVLTPVLFMQFFMKSSELRGFVDRVTSAH
jgi:hypothetical protein